ncbi:hypothetical protein [Asanoa sp. NPDC050611]|uniref:hypothetical protein n=1 Tax=Asanoa sp. NPDC050611 TaxID=3157098 RepID=UPI0033F22960
MTGARPRVAVICTTFFTGSHADVIAGRLCDGYVLEGRRLDPRVEVVAMYLELLGTTTDEPWPVADMGVEFMEKRGIPRFESVAEAIGCGRPGVDVDGVVIIGEHGDYPRNEFGQKLYPRRRLFDAAVSTMLGAGRTVPIFCNKGLSWSAGDARHMVDTARRLGIPLLAGSSIPLARRRPAATVWPSGAPMDAAVLVGYGPTEMYGFHNLEALQIHVERRAGGESGVAAVEALLGDDARRAVADGRVDTVLFDRAMDRFELSEADRERALGGVREVTLLEYRDGLRAAVVNVAEGAGIEDFAVACRGPEADIACHMWAQEPGHGNFTFLVRQIESMILDGVAPYPAERTQLTTSVLDVAMRAWHRGGGRVETPDLAIAYAPPATIPDSGILAARPEG